MRCVWVCNLYVYFFVTIYDFLGCCMFFLLLGVKFDLLVRTEGFFGDCLLFLFLFSLFLLRIVLFVPLLVYLCY